MNKLNNFFEIESSNINININLKNDEVLEYSFVKENKKKIENIADFEIKIKIDFEKVLELDKKTAKDLEKFIYNSTFDESNFYKICVGKFFENKKIRQITFPNAYVNVFFRKLDYAYGTDILEIYIKQKYSLLHKIQINTHEPIIVRKDLTSMPNKFREQVPFVKNAENEYLKIDQNLKKHAGVEDIFNNLSVASEDPVNLATGNFIYFVPDMILAGYLPITLYRFYNAIDDFKGIFGFNWHYSYCVKMFFYEEEIKIEFDDGHVERFFRKDDEKFESEKGINKILKCNQEVFDADTKKKYFLINKDKSTLEFDQDGNLTKKIDDKGNEIQFLYEQNLLKSIKNICSILNFEYNSQGFVENISDNCGRIIKYSYEKGNLVTISDSEQNITKYEYCCKTNRLESIINHLGEKTILNLYDENARTICQNFPDNSKISYIYDKENLKTEIIERNGSKVSYYYDKNYRIYKEEYFDGTIEKMFDQNNNLIQLKDKKSKISRFEYDNKGRLTKEIDHINNETKYFYGISDKLIKILYPNENIQQFKYDYKGNLICNIDPMKNEVSYKYDEEGFLVETKYPNDSKTNNFYDKKGNFTEFIDQQGNTYSYKYDKFNRIIEIIYPQKNNLKIQYTLNGNLESIVNGNKNQKKYKYDAVGNVIQIIDFRGNTTLFEYNNMRYLTKKIDALGGKTYYEYDEMGNLTKYTDELGYFRIYKYDQRNLLKYFVDENQNKTFYDYDSNGNLICITNALGETIFYEYDDLDRNIAIINQENQKTTIFYDCVSNISKVVDCLGNEKSFIYDKNGKCIQKINEIGAKISYKYDKSSNLCFIEDALGNVLKYYYNKSNQIEQIVDAKNQKKQIFYNQNGKISEIIDQKKYSTKYFYDKNDNLIKYLTHENHEYNYFYDENNNLIKIMNPKQNFICFEYDELNRKIAEIDSKGFKKSIFYDSKGRIIKLQNFEGNTCIYEYDNMQNVTKIIDAYENQTLIEYDKLGRICKQISAKGAIKSIEYTKTGLIKEISEFEGNFMKFYYDSLGRLIKQSNHLEEEYFFEYDKLGRVTKVINPLGDYKTFKYNFNDQITQIIDELENTTTYLYDCCGNIIQTIDALGHSSYFEYDELNRLKKVILYNDDNIQNKQITLYEYNSYGLLTKVINSQNNQKSYIYDEIGNLLQTIDEDGYITQYTYDSKNLLKLLNYNNQKKVFFEYNKEGNLILFEDWQGQTKFELDKLERITKTTDYNNRVIKYKYDEVGNIKKVTYCDESSIEYDYDAINRLISVVDDQKNTTKYEYNSKNQLSSVKYPNNFERSYEYDKIGRPVKILDKNFEDVIFSNNFIYDKVGNLLNENKNYYFYQNFDSNANSIKKENINYFYDKLNNLIKIEDNANNLIKIYKYDSLNNLVFEKDQENQINYSFNNLNQIAKKTTKNQIFEYKYDKRGNLLVEIQKNIDSDFDNIIYEYEFDCCNKLVSFKKQHEKKCEYNYNGLGLLVCNRYFEESNQKINENYEFQKKDYVIDYTRKNFPELMIFEKDNFIKISYGLEKISAQKNYVSNINNKIYFHTDRLKSNIYTTDDKGKINSQTLYDQWGQILFSSKSKQNDFDSRYYKNFTGHFYDDNMQNYFAKLRFYDPTNKRFISKDPEQGCIEDQKSLSSYNYCYNNPCVYVDSTGAVCYYFVSLEDDRGVDYFNQDKNFIKKRYNLRDDEIIYKKIENYQQFVYNWNKMGIDPKTGKELSIDLVVISAHGRGNAIEFSQRKRGNESRQAPTEITVDPKNLKVPMGAYYPIEGEPIYDRDCIIVEKDVRKLFLMCCDTANKSYEHNIAEAFAHKIKGGDVMASDGVVKLSVDGEGFRRLRVQEDFYKNFNIEFWDTKDKKYLNEYRPTEGFYSTKIIDGKKVISDISFNKTSLLCDLYLLIEHFDPKTPQVSKKTLTPKSIKTNSKIVTDI